MTKTKIIEAAFKVWGRDYYKKTSLSQLAGELGVSKTALYRHFENKQALVSAMADRFYDDFAASIRDDFEQALQAKDADKGIYLIIQSIAGYFARNGYALIFTLVNIYDWNLDPYTMSERIKARGADMKTLRQVMGKKYDVSPAVIKMVFATLVFFMSYFIKTKDYLEKTPSDDEVQNIISTIYKVINTGLEFKTEKAGALDFEKLEKKINGMENNMETEPLFKAIAEAVAEAGPWKATMEMAAKRMGLSKSSLYGHFKNKKDMLRRLFNSEFKSVKEFAGQGIKMSLDPAEQLYLGILSISLYLRSRPEVLVAIGWIRTRKLDFGKPDKLPEVYRMFDDIKIDSLLNVSDEEKHRIFHWILFLLINILIRPNLPGNELLKKCSSETSLNVQNDDIRVLYKFITLGLRARADNEEHK